ncbi:MAG: VWA domain-containing protein [Myxococcales bacterium]|nr:VWA domain-containing protein [Myxococcales bacterium]
MGYGEYSHAAHVALTTARAARPTEVFTQRSCHALMDPNGAWRECRDSEDHPAARGVVFALDVTGSMGEIPRKLATETLPDFVSALLESGVQDPAVCFVAVGHALADRAPLQVGQFESTAALIDLWLTRLWLEGGGAGQHEAYELAMLFAARRMRLDSVDKRGQRAFLFLTGDTAPNPAVSRVQAERLLGERLDADLPIRDLIEELQRTFEPFFLVAPGVDRRVERAWRDLLGDRVVVLEDAEDAAWVAAGLVALLQGSADDRMVTLSSWLDRVKSGGIRRKRRARIARALVPFAASIGRDGAPRPDARRVELPKGDRRSGMRRT